MFKEEFSPKHSESLESQNWMSDIERTVIISCRGFSLLVIADKSCQFLLFCVMEAKVCVGHFNTFLFGAISTVNILKNF